VSIDREITSFGEVGGGWRAKNRARALRGLRSTISVSGAHGPGRAVGLDSIGGEAQEGWAGVSAV